MANPRVRSVLLSRLNKAPGNSQGDILGEARRCILDGEVPPGSAIPVDAVAAAFGVSRIPVREALMTLIGEGLVDHRPNAGYRAAKMTPRSSGRSIWSGRRSRRRTAPGDRRAPGRTTSRPDGPSCA